MDRLFRLLVLLLIPFAAVSGQNSPQPLPARAQPTGPATDSSTPATPSANRTITLDVQVADKSGAPIRGLQQQDFILLDDKEPQKIVSFQAVSSATPAADDPPIEIVLIVDAVNAPLDTVTYERDQIKKFLLQNGGELARPVALIVFSDGGTKVMKGSSRDGNALAALFDQYETGLRSITKAQGFYGAEERFELSLKAIDSFVASEGKLPGRKLMIWVSPGWPLLSGRNVELSSKNEQAIFNSIVADSSALSQARIMLYSVDPLGSADAASNHFYEEFLKGITSPSQVRPGNISLQVLAIQSGGRVLSSTNDLAAAIATCATDAGDYYVLSFDAHLSQKPNEYHSIEIKVEKPGATTRARTGYYAQP
jgi:VWFA-related protein